MRLPPDAVIPRLEDRRPRYHARPTFEVIARHVLSEIVLYLGTSGVRMLERLAEAQGSSEYKFAHVNVYVPGEEPHEHVLVVECAGNQVRQR